MPASQSSRLSLAALGTTRKLALRKVLTEFRHRGWRDVDGAALAIISRLSEQGGEATPRSAAAAPSPDFLVQNELRRRDLESALTDLSQRAQQR